MGELAWRRAHGCAGCVLPGGQGERESSSVCPLLLQAVSQPPAQAAAPSRAVRAGHTAGVPRRSRPVGARTASQMSAPPATQGPEHRERGSGYGSSTNQARPYFSPFKTAHAPKAPSNAPKVLHPLTRDPSSSALPHETGQSTAHLPRPRGLCTCLSSVQAGGPATLIRAPASVRTFLSLPLPLIAAPSPAGSWAH